MCISRIKSVVAVCVVVLVILVFCRCYGGSVVEGNSDGTNAKCNYNVTALYGDMNAASGEIVSVLKQLEDKMSNNSSQLESNYAIDYAKASQVLAAKVERCATVWSGYKLSDQIVNDFKNNAYSILKNVKGISDGDGATYMACKEIELIICANKYFVQSLNVVLNTIDETFNAIKDSFDCLNGVSLINEL